MTVIPKSRLIHLCCSTWGFLIVTYQLIGRYTHDSSATINRLCKKTTFRLHITRAQGERPSVTQRYNLAAIQPIQSIRGGCSFWSSLWIKDVNLNVDDRYEVRALTPAAFWILEVDCQKLPYKVACGAKYGYQIKRKSLLIKHTGV